MTEPSGTERDAWHRVREAFDQAAALPPEGRAAFLADIAAADPALAAEVRSLIAAHERADTFLDHAAAPQADLDALARSTPIAGRMIGHYRLLRVLGEGGMGVVYLADDTRLNRTVALKAVAPRFAHDERRASRLRQEARAAASLVDPGVATVFALEEIDGGLYIATEYVAGQTLRDELAAGPLSPQAAAGTLRAIASALLSAHRAGLVHRDLKPENVMRTPEGAIKILDFGLARVAWGQTPGVRGLTPLGSDAAYATAGDVAGTPAYMSPEQIRGSAVDGRSDLFALGVIAAELLLGEHPFAAATSAATIARILETDPDVTVGRVTASRSSSATATSPDDRLIAGLTTIVRTLLKKSPDARFQSASEVIAALDRLHAGSGPVSISASADSGSPAVDRARWWWRFHELTTSAFYVVLLAPLWLARDAGGHEAGTLLFLAALVAVIVAGALRLHLCFAASQYPEAWRPQDVRARPWIRASDLVLTAVLLTVGLLAVHTDAGSGVLLVASSAAVIVSALVIEPATRRAAFD